MALYASGVSVPAGLSGALGGGGGIGFNASNAIGSNYAKAKSQLSADATARGLNGNASVAPGSYSGNQLATKQGLDTGNLESALGGGLGSTAYENTLQQRGFGQNEDLATQIAELNKMSTLQQVLAGLGQVGGTATQIYGAFGKNKSSPSTTATAQGPGTAYNPMQPGPLDLGYSWGGG